MKAGVRCAGVAVLLVVMVLIVVLELSRADTEARTWLLAVEDGDVVDAVDGGVDADDSDEGQPAPAGGGRWRRKLVCMLMRTTSPRDEVKTRVIRETWGRVCDVLETPDAATPGLEIDWEETASTLSRKAHRSWAWVIQKHVIDAVEPADFIMKADFDTYIHPEHLRRYLREFSPNAPHYVGRQFVDDQQRHFVAGAAVVLSRAASVRLYTALQPLPADPAVGEHERHPHTCSEVHFNYHGHADDVALGVCLAHLGIYPHDTRDDAHRERFMPFPPTDYSVDIPTYFPDNSWLYKYGFNKIRGRGACSPEAVAFHHVPLRDMWKALVYNEATGLWRFE